MLAGAWVRDCPCPVAGRSFKASCPSLASNAPLLFYADLDRPEAGAGRRNAEGLLGSPGCLQRSWVCLERPKCR
jgi:hypothetical protein